MAISPERKAEILALAADEVEAATMFNPELTYFADGTRVVMRARGEERRGVTFGRTESGAVYGFQAVRWEDGAEDLVAPHVLSRDEEPAIEVDEPGEFGVWSDAAGGVVADSMTKTEAERERVRLVEEDDEDAEDLQVVKMCEQHRGEPADWCEECETDGEEPEDEDAEESADEEPTAEEPTAERLPYDADHVITRRETSAVYVFWTASPERAEWAKTAHVADLLMADDFETVATAYRYYKTSGATFSGWIVTSGGYPTDPIPNAREMREALAYVVADYFPRAAEPATEEPAAEVEPVEEAPAPEQAEAVEHKTWQERSTKNPHHVVFKCTCGLVSEEFSGWNWALDAADRHRAEVASAPALRLVEAPRRPRRAFCRICLRSIVPAATVEYSDGRKLHFCTDHVADAEEYHAAAAERACECGMPSSTLVRHDEPGEEPASDA